MRVGSLFSGIGGIDLGLERAGMDIAFQVEIDPWCRRVLAKHWPDVRRHADIRDVGAHNLEPVDVLAGGFPCQPVSSAGKRLAQDDERWMWPEFARLVRELRPRYVLVENVPGLLVRGMGDVLGDLAACGYDAEWDCIPAAAVGAPHLRDRVWIVAYPDGSDAGSRSREQQGSEPTDGQPAQLLSDSGGRGGTAAARSDYRTADVADPSSLGEPDESSSRDDASQPFGSQPRASSRARGRIASEGDRVVGGGTGFVASRCASVSATDAQRRGGRSRLFGTRGWRELADGRGWPAEPSVGRVVDGLPGRVDRLRGLGNAVVPQVVEWIGRLIMADAMESV